MGLIRKLGLKGAGLLKSKLGKQAVKKVGGNSKIVKTSVKTTKGKAPAVTGGKEVVKSVARKSKALGSAVKIGGSSLIVGGGLAGTGAILGKSFDYIQDVRFKTPEQRQAEQAYNLYEDITESSNKQDISETEPSAVGDDSGAEFLDFYEGMQDAGEQKEDTKQSLIKGAMLIGGLGAGIYVLNKAGIFKKITKTINK